MAKRVFQSIEDIARSMAPARAAIATSFPFSKTTRLFEVFPQSARGMLLNPSELEHSVKLVHPFQGPAARANEWASFQIVGAAGDTIIETSTVPENAVVYHEVFETSHDDPAARRMVVSLFEVNVGRDTIIYDTGVAVAVGGGTGLVPQGVHLSFRKLWVPSGFQVKVNVPLLAAGQVIQLTGTTAVYGLADTPPPGY